jgi:hypothetical protein
VATEKFVRRALDPIGLRIIEAVRAERYPRKRRRETSRLWSLPADIRADGTMPLAPRYVMSPKPVPLIRNAQNRPKRSSGSSPTAPGVSPRFWASRPRKSTVKSGRGFQRTRRNGTVALSS